MGDEFSITARWLFPVAAAPLERGVATVRDGRFVTVETAGTRKADVDFGNAAIVPGFVNAHTHLDLSGARGLTPPQSDFTQWLRSVIAYRKSRTPDQVESDIQAGIDECLRHGTTLVGDITVDGRSGKILSGSSMRSIAFREFIGLTAERSQLALLDACRWLEESDGSTNCKHGLSPHATYSVSESLIADLIDLAVQRQAPLCIHLAESAEEIELLRNRSSAFEKFLRELGAWAPDALVPEPATAVYTDIFPLFQLLVHCNYLDPRTLISPFGTVVFCPRTHAAFGHPPHPFREFANHGVRVALGTDSLASNPDLSVLAEARFIASRFPELDKAYLLRMATISGAGALALHEETGSLEPGKSADFAVVRLPDRDDADPHELLLDSELPVQSTWFRGECVFAK